MEHAHWEKKYIEIINAVRSIEALKLSTKQYTKEIKYVNEIFIGFCFSK